MWDGVGGDRCTHWLSLGTFELFLHRRIVLGDRGQFCDVESVLYCDLLVGRVVVVGREAVQVVFVDVAHRVFKVWDLYEHPCRWALQRDNRSQQTSSPRATTVVQVAQTRAHGTQICQPTFAIAGGRKDHARRAGRIYCQRS